MIHLFPTLDDFCHALVWLFVLRGLNSARRAFSLELKLGGALAREFCRSVFLADLQRALRRGIGTYGVCVLLLGFRGVVSISELQALFLYDFCGIQIVSALIGLVAFESVLAAGRKEVWDVAWNIARTSWKQVALALMCAFFRLPVDLAELLSRSTQLATLALLGFAVVPFFNLGFQIHWARLASRFHRVPAGQKAESQPTAPPPKKAPTGAKAKAAPQKPRPPTGSRSRPLWN